MTLPPGFSELMNEATTASPRLGAPGVYFTSGLPVEALAPEAMDVAAFVGVAARGPAWEVTTDPDVEEGEPFRARSVAVPVTSWDEYVELFGGFEGPGLLPYAASAYFAQGGALAYVVRVVAWQPCRPVPDLTPPGCAELRIGPEQTQRGAQSSRWLRVAARNEGTWGNHLSVRVQFTRRRLTDISASVDSAEELKLPPGALVTPGATLVLTAPSPDREADPMNLAPARTEYRTVDEIQRRPHLDRPGSDLSVVLEPPVDLTVSMTVDVVEADVVVTDLGDPDRPRVETLRAVGFDERHPRFVERVIGEESRLIQFVSIESTQLGDAVRRGRVSSELEQPGVDLWDSLVPEDVFQVRGASRTTESRLQWNEPEAHAGVGAVTLIDDVASVVVPDLYAPWARLAPLAETETDTRPPTFASCTPPDAPLPPPPASPPGLRLDPTDPVDRAHILTLQQALVSWAEAAQRIVLLDVPPGLTMGQVLAWRAQLDSGFAAAYHPWLRTPAPPSTVRPVPPSAVAAGVIARSERAHGIARGPANEIGVSIVDVETAVSPADHTTLHRLGVNIFLVDVDGIRLTAARTLSSDAQWRQLSVRRLLLSIERACRARLAWAVFEPNDSRLRDALRRQLDSMLHALFEQGSFAGSTPDESWFVHIAEPDDPRAQVDAARVIVEIGVAPAEPLEFIIVQVALQAEGDIKVALRSGAGVGVSA